MVLGNSGVDLSSQVRLISRLLLKGPVSKSLRCEVLEDFKYSGNSDREFQIRLLAQESQSWVSGTGRNARIDVAWIKALMELSEALIAKRSGFQSRVGLAGGLTVATATQRAKAECIERDAFLYHYQSRAAAQYMGDLAPEVGVHLEVYRLASAFQEFEICLVWDRRFSLEGSRGLSFGTAAGLTFSQAKNEAIREWSSTKANLRHFDPDSKKVGTVETRNLSSLKQKRIHLDACFDPRNIDRFNRCFRREYIDLPKRSEFRNINGDWLIRSFESPIYFGKFIHASPSALQSLFFGRPEGLYEDEDPSAPLFHPFW